MFWKKVRMRENAKIIGKFCGKNREKECAKNEHLKKETEKKETEKNGFLFRHLPIFISWHFSPKISDIFSPKLPKNRRSTNNFF